MNMTKRITSLAAALTVALATVASAQALATFGSAEVAGFGEGSALIGTSLSTGRQGWGPVASLVAQTYRYRSGPSAHAQAYALSPALGLNYTTSVGAVQAALGYSFVNTDVPDLNIIGVETGSKSGPFVSAMTNYWGNGENSAQAIGSYGFANEYYWSRLRASHRLAPAVHPIYLGGEFVFQGTQKTQAIGTTGRRTSAASRYQFGPTIEYRISPDFRVGASGGYRGGHNNAAGTGYGRVEFLALTRW